MHNGMVRPALALLAGLLLGVARPGHAGDAAGGVFGEAVTVLTMAHGGAWGGAVADDGRAHALRVPNRT